MSENKDDTVSIRISQVLAGAMAAVTAALIGSTMGVAGTVVGAGLASVISTVGGALYLRSIERTRESVRTVVKAKVVGRSGGATVLVSDEKPATGEVVEADTESEDAGERSADEPEEKPAENAEDGQTSDDRPPVTRRRLRWPVLVVTSIAAFALGMLVITGVEWLRGEPLSGGSGTTFDSIVEPHRDSGGGDGGQPVSPTTSDTAPTDTNAPTSTDTTNTTEPTTTSTPPSSDETTTSTPPVTTTTESPPPSSPSQPSQQGLPTLGS
jgi:hypothetical protein